MQYQEELAYNLQRKHKLAPGTIRTWKSRNHIPDYYADPSYKRSKPATAWEYEEFKRFVDFPYVYARKIEGIAPFRYGDYSRNGIIKLTKKEANAIRKHLRKFQRALDKFIQVPNFQNLLKVWSLPFVNKRKLVANNRLYDMTRKNKHQRYTKEDAHFLMNHFKEIVENIPFV